MRNWKDAGASIFLSSLGSKLLTLVRPKFSRRQKPKELRFPQGLWGRATCTWHQRLLACGSKVHSQTVLISAPEAEFAQCVSVYSCSPASLWSHCPPAIWGGLTGHVPPSALSKHGAAVPPQCSGLSAPLHAVPHSSISMGKGSLHCWTWSLGSQSTLLVHRVFPGVWGTSCTLKYLLSSLRLKINSLARVSNKILYCPYCTQPPLHHI